MPGPTPVPVHGDEAVPSRADVVVIGGGIIGASTALELAERGHRVVLCEKGGIGHEQSSRNWGWVRISRRDPREVPLMVEAIRLWSELDRRTGADTGYRQAGIAFVCADERSFEENERWRRHLEPYQIESRMVTGDALDRLVPNYRAHGALFTPIDGRAEPQRVAPAIAEAARRKGATLLSGCAVRAIETAGGAVSGVVSERGSIACSQVVLAGGAWSNLFCANAGLDLPQLNIINHVLRTEPVEGGPEHAVWTGDFALRKRQDGGYTVARSGNNTVDIVPDSFRYGRRYLSALRAQHRDLHFRLGPQFLAEARRPRRWPVDAPSPFERERVRDPSPAPRMTSRLLGAVSDAFPVFRDVKIAQTWAGCIDVTPDAVPVISAVDNVPGFHIASGFSGHGFGIGPAAGQLMADIVTGTVPCVDPAPFRFSRFTDGSEVRIESGV